VKPCAVLRLHLSKDEIARLREEGVV